MVVVFYSVGTFHSASGVYNIFYCSNVRISEVPPWRGACEPCIAKRVLALPTAPGESPGTRVPRRERGRGDLRGRDAQRQGLSLQRVPSICLKIVQFRIRPCSAKHAARHVSLDYSTCSPRRRFHMNAASHFSTVLASFGRFAREICTCRFRIVVRAGAGGVLGVCRARLEVYNRGEPTRAIRESRALRGPAESLARSMLGDRPLEGRAPARCPW